MEALHREARGECHASPGAVVLVIELMKIVLALVLLAEIKGNPILSVMKTTVTHPLDCLKVIVPAVLYVIQNQLLLVAAANLEACTRFIWPAEDPHHRIIFGSITGQNIRQEKVGRSGGTNRRNSHGPSLADAQRWFR